jgi:hypothetical protein
VERTRSTPEDIWKGPEAL